MLCQLQKDLGILIWVGNQRRLPQSSEVNLTDQLISQTIAADEHWTEADTDAGCVSVENECLVRIIVNEVMKDINGLTE